jgi:hypothetical protein
MDCTISGSYYQPQDRRSCTLGATTTTRRRRRRRKKGDWSAREHGSKLKCAV